MYILIFPQSSATKQLPILIEMQFVHPEFCDSGRLVSDHVRLR